jgi:hypothetical protein
VYGLNFSTRVSTSPPRADAILTRKDFHKVSRALGPQETGVVFEKTDSVSHLGSQTFLDEIVLQRRRLAEKETALGRKSVFGLFSLATMP